jgi:hypothetical protein
MRCGVSISHVCTIRVLKEGMTSPTAVTLGG